MPPLPETPDGQGLVGNVEVFRQGHPYHLADAAGHVGVAAEIEIELKRVAQDHSQGGGAVQGGDVVIPPIGSAAKGLGQQDFFPHSQ